MAAPACLRAVAQKLLKEKCATCDFKTMPNSGPAPVLARFADFRAATPLWEELSLWIETHEEAKKQLGERQRPLRQRPLHSAGPHACVHACTHACLQMCRAALHMRLCIHVQNMVSFLRPLLSYAFLFMCPAGWVREMVRMAQARAHRHPASFMWFGPD